MLVIINKTPMFVYQVKSMRSNIPQFMMNQRDLQTVPRRTARGGTSSPADAPAAEEDVAPQQ